MAHKEAEARTAAGGSPLEHLQVAVGIAERGDRPAANVGFNGDWLGLLVIKEAQGGQLDEHRLAVAHFKAELACAADDLLRWDAVDPLGKAAHEVDAATGYDECLKTVGTKIGEQLDHRLVDHLRVEPTRLGMLRSGQSTY